MKTIRIAILPLILALVVPVRGQPNGSGPLSLVVKPIKKVFCRGDGQVAFLRVLAELQFANRTKNQIVSLNKGDVHVDYIQVAKEAKDLSTKNYELRINTTAIVGSSANLDRLSPNLFLTLKPGQHSTIELSFDIPVSTQAGTAVEGTVLPGIHFVVIWVSGWLGSEDFARQVESKLSGIGKLWTSAVRSSAIELVVEPPSVTQSCN